MEGCSLWEYRNKLRIEFTIYSTDDSISQNPLEWKQYIERIDEGNVTDPRKKKYRWAQKKIVRIEDGTGIRPRP